MPVTEIGDPRLQALFGASDPRDAGVRPTVRLPRRGLPPLVLGAIAMLCALLLFLVLNERRTSQSEPDVKVRPDARASVWAPPPTLYIPPQMGAPPQQPLIDQQQRPAMNRGASPMSDPVARQAPVQSVYIPQPMAQMALPPSAPPPPPSRAAGGAPLVIDTGGSSGATGGAAPVATITGQAVQSVSRMRASALANRAMTITQGTVIQGVLETGFDSTRPGFARAVVSRDVRSFDAQNVLIPRGSKLIGEYRSEVAQGQKRAVIIWTRLIRPDGMTIMMDSPAVDTIGRGGVPATVNTHFFARLGDALLQSTIGIGSALAQRTVSGPVVVVPQGAAAAVGQAAPAANYVPTLTVPAGKSISVFVAHDLDFSAAAGGR